MVQLTERASVELRRLRTEHLARPQQGVRLSLKKEGGLAMAIDVPRAGDSVVRRDNTPILILDGRLAASLAMRVLDFPEQSKARRGFTLGWRTPTEQ